MFLAHGVEYLNPDVAAREITSRNPGISQVEANSAAWQEGKRLLERAIVEKLDLAFETTLGGRTITGRLEKALAVRIEVRIWQVGLTAGELHLDRVNCRVGKGGHPIPEERSRAP